MSLESSDGNVDADVSESKEPNTVGTNVNLDSEQIGEQKYAAQKIRNAVDLNDLASQPPAVQSNFDHQFASSHRVYVKVMHPYEPRRSDEITLRLGDQIQLLSSDCRHSGGDGWWVGQEPSTGRIGVFPSSYVSFPAHFKDVKKRHASELANMTNLSTPPVEQSASALPTTGVGDAATSNDGNDGMISVNEDTTADLLAVVGENDRSPADLGDTSQVDKRDLKVPQIAGAEVIQQQFIGSGAFGTVYRGRWRSTDVALKVLDLSASQVHKEASHLCRLSHRNVIKFYGICHLGDPSLPALVMEFAYGGPLNLVLAEHPVLGPSTLLDWALQIATGMTYLHDDAKLVHRDLKSSNILIREPITKPYTEKELQDCTLVITDFGMACRYSELVPQQSKLGTVAYAAPEVCRQTGFSFNSDVWAYGVVLWELLTLEAPFRAMEQPRLLYLIAMYNYTLHVPPDVPDLFAKLLTDCWNPQPESRPSFDQIIARLETTKHCDFLSIDSDELSRIQKEWRESIAAHYEEEQKSAAATLSSNMTSTELAEIENDLLVQMESLRCERECLDREKQQLAERAHQIDLKEASYSHMVGTMRRQFMMLAVLAANQLKEMPCPHEPCPKPPPPRKRPFVLNLFRRWGSGDAYHTTKASSSSSLTKERKISMGSQKNMTQQQPPSPQKLSPVSCNPAYGDTLSPSYLSANPSRLGCSVGGVPQISAPANMKHVVHVDQDWVTSFDLNQSTIRLFPSALGEDYDLGQLDTPRTPRSSPFQHCISSGRIGQVQELYVHSPSYGDYSLLEDTMEERGSSHHPCRIHNRQDGSGQVFLDSPANERLVDGDISEDRKPVSSVTFAANQTSFGRFGLRTPMRRSCKGVPRILHKTATHQSASYESSEVGDFLHRSCSHAVGASHFFTPNSTDTSGLEQNRINGFSDSRHSPPASGKPSADTPLPGCTVSPCFDYSPNETCTWRYEHAYERSSPSSVLPQESETRQRSASGPNSSGFVNAHSVFIHSPWDKTVQKPEKPRPDEKLIRMLYSGTPPSSVVPPRYPSLVRPDEQVCATEPCGKKSRNPPTAACASHPCIESALWSAFRLAVSLSCLSGHEITRENDRDVEPSVVNPHLPTVVDQPTGEVNAAKSCRFQQVKSSKRSSRGRLLRIAQKANSNNKLDSDRPQTAENISLIDPRKHVGNIDQWDIFGASSANVLSRMIDEIAEVGDPHSPFLGMLAGSGRRPNPPGNYIDLSKNNQNFNQYRWFGSSPVYQPSTLSSREAFSPHDEDSTCTMRKKSHPGHFVQYRPFTPDEPKCSCANHPLEHKSFDVLPNPRTLCPQSSDQFIHTVVSRIRKQSASLGPTCKLNCIENPRPSHSLGKQHASRVPLPTSLLDPEFGQSNQHSVQLNETNCQFCTHRQRPSFKGSVGVIAGNADDRNLLFTSETPSFGDRCTFEPKADPFSHRSLSSASFNPVALSRDAYLTVTKDGYLNRPAYSPNRPPPELVPDPFPVLNTPECRMFASRRTGASCSALAGVDNSPTDPHVRAPEGETDEREHSDSDDSDSFSYPAHCRPGPDEDGLTLVPSDGWESDARPTGAPHSRLKTDGSIFYDLGSPVDIQGHVRTKPDPNTVSTLPRRPLHRSQAMRESHRPRFMQFSRNRSVPETREISDPIDSRGSSPLPNIETWCPMDSANRRHDSPCGPFVSLHSTLL
ncbi:unnamed protein product [Calicophoron daubneyi]|uniref:mitogen-activated protein kinase kinase kinase n=1 Tax=Calicophoron daubneyi TaxID=300641 RepID=A0AAV2T8Z1_CALDB